MRRRGRLSRSVLSGSRDADHEIAAWDFLDAVRELFPDRFADLETQWLGLEGPDSAALNLDDLDETAAAWALENRISCDAVNAVLRQIVRGLDGEGTVVRYFDKHLEEIKFPSITAAPTQETLDEFLSRARKQYKQIRNSFLKGGYRARPTKREADHFRYLAANLVGGYSWAQMARRETPFTFSASRAAKTIAGEARKAALLIGIALPTSPGPRPGSRLPRRRRRSRRA
jgi:hypothetical protein